MFDNDTEWQKQIAQRLTSASALAHYLGISTPDNNVKEAEALFPMAVTPYYASLIKKPVENDPIFLQCMPSGKELINPPWLTNNPLGELECSHGRHLIHRYPDRAVLLISSECATYCRHCTRKRVASVTLPHIAEADLDHACKYLHEHPKVSDILVSGGDPLLLNDETVELIISKLNSIPSVRIIRIATRTLVTLPMRITKNLVTILKKSKNIFVNTQFNHPNEVTPLAIEAVSALIDNGIPVGNQFVLLKNINNDKHIVEELCRLMIYNRIRPYYMFQCDLVKGVEHFRTHIQEGLDIMQYLRGRLSGMAIPNFAVDIPGLSGKVELLPNYILREDDTYTYLSDNNGNTTTYPHPIAID